MPNITSLINCDESNSFLVLLFVLTNGGNINQSSIPKLDFCHFRIANLRATTIAHTGGKIAAAARTTGASKRIDAILVERIRN